MALLSRIDKTVNYRLFVSVVPGYGGENVIVLLASLVAFMPGMPSFNPGSTIQTTHASCLWCSLELLSFIRLVIMDIFTVVMMDCSDRVLRLIQADLFACLFMRIVFAHMRDRFLCP